jgi:ABC-type dipeptide/oligopeptide/nickel transport system permease component
MLPYLIRRLILFVPTIWVALTLVFVIFRLVPGDPARLMAGDAATEEAIEALRVEMGLDRSIFAQYLNYLGDLLQGDLGRSRVYQQNALEPLMDRLPNTLLLATAAMAIALAVGVTAGVISALKPGSWLDHVSMFTAVIGVSMPSFWLGLMLVILFSVRLEWLPVAGYNERLAIVLPALTLAANQMAVLARMTRSTMLGVMSQDYVRTARAKGLRERVVVVMHALRNAMIPTMTVAGMQLGYLLGGSLVVEAVFAWPGLGRLMLDSIQQRDYPLIQAIVLVFAVLMLGVNLLVDVLYVVVDPRVRYG